MKVFYSDTYQVPLPKKHRFPMGKYQLLRELLIEQEILPLESFIESDVCGVEDLLLAHDEDYITRVLSLSLERKEARPIGLPLTVEMVLRARASMDAFLSATFAALKDGVSASLAGGTHHAHRNRGEGFCFFNDFAVAVRKVHLTFPHSKILILDLDVHQGNGNSSILAEDKNVKVISFHGETNYPYKKIPSHIDIAFPKGTKDDIYLKKLREVLGTLPTFDLILYQAGVDTLAEDQFGHLQLTHNGLIKRDELVFNFAKKNKTPLAMALGGGYTNPVDISVEAYLNTYKTLKRILL